MALLIDTQVLLWALYEPQKIPAALRARLVDPGCRVCFSAVSIAEIAIKASLGRRDFPFQPDEVATMARETGFVELPLNSGQAALLARLPWHHRDPFDRLLVAQALLDGLRLVTTDRALPAYSDLVECVV